MIAATSIDGGTALFILLAVFIVICIVIAIRRL